MSDTYECAMCHKVYGVHPGREAEAREEFKAQWGRYPSPEEMANRICEPCAQLVQADIAMHKAAAMGGVTLHKGESYPLPALSAAECHYNDIPKWWVGVPMTTCRLHTIKANL